MELVPSLDCHTLRAPICEMGTEGLPEEVMEVWELVLSRSEGRTEVVRLERRSSLEPAEVGEGEVGPKVS